MKTARDVAHELAAGIVPACYSINFDDGAGADIEHSHHCDFLTAAIEADRREARAAALRMVADAVATRPPGLRITVTQVVEYLRKEADRAERGE